MKKLWYFVYACNTALLLCSDENLHQKKKQKIESPTHAENISEDEYSESDIDDILLAACVKDASTYNAAQIKVELEKYTKDQTKTPVDGRTYHAILKKFIGRF